VTRIVPLVVAVAALALSACETTDDAALDDLVAFAREPSAENWAAVPFADHVQLGLGDRLLRTRSARALREPAAWRLDVRLFRGGVGPFSALDVLARNRSPLQYREGSYRHCASPPRPPPRSLSRLRRLSIQPRETESCLQWFAVDVFLDESGKIRAVTLDLWEP